MRNGKARCESEAGWQFHLEQVGPHHMLAAALCPARSKRQAYEFELREISLTSS